MKDGQVLCSKKQVCVVLFLKLGVFVPLLQCDFDKSDWYEKGFRS